MSGLRWGKTEREIAAALKLQFGQDVKVKQISESLHGILREYVVPTIDKRWLGLRPEERLSELEREQAIYSSGKLWGLFTIAQRDIGEVLLWVGRIEEAWFAFMAAVYLSQNGPRNHGLYIDTPEGRKFAPKSRHWEPEQRGFVTNSAWDIKWLAHKLGADKAATKATFLDIALVRYRELKLPLSPEAVWKQIVKSKIWKEPVE